MRFWLQFSSSVFGVFDQALVFDFGNGSILTRSLCVSVVSEDIYASEEQLSSRKTYCRFVEWSVDEIELVLCKDALQRNLDNLGEQYSLPEILPDPANFPEITNETYSNIWHNILFIEEQYIQKEVAR